MSSRANHDSRMRILIVGMAESVHVARWVGQILHEKWAVRVFPSNSPARVHPILEDLGVHVYSLDPLRSLMNRIRSAVVRLPFEVLRLSIRQIFPRPDRCAALRRVIRRFRPDIIHSIETQHAGYLVQQTKERHFDSAAFPTWLHTNWGSDIFLFGMLSQHEDRVRTVLRDCDYYSCEGQRDVDLARQFGFSKTVAGCFPNTGGFDIERIRGLRESQPPSRRRTILLKGYQGWTGRALVGIKALSLLGRELQGYSVLVFGNWRGIDVAIAAELLSANAGIPVRVLPYVGHDEMLELYASARAYIGLTISDGIGTSLLEAMAMGAFPIQSDTSMANEWIVHEQTGVIVPAEEPLCVSQWIRRALVDDRLVDSASTANWEVITRRADAQVLRRKTVDMYKVIGTRR